jgi:molecular chaperone GrpE
MPEDKTTQDVDDSVSTDPGEERRAEEAAGAVQDQVSQAEPDDELPELDFENGAIEAPAEEPSEAPAAEQAEAESDEIARLREDIERMQGEQEHLRERYLRKLAEFDNFRKRTEKERQERERVAGEGIVRELVPVLDNFDRALQHANGSDPGAFRQGVEMIARQLWDTLQRQGLAEMNPLHQPFEPEFHEAVQRVEESDQEPGTVVSVMAKGYLFGGRLIRPAMVGVAVAPAPAEPAEPTESTEPPSEPTESSTEPSEPPPEPGEPEDQGEGEDAS